MSGLTTQTLTRGICFLRPGLSSNPVVSHTPLVSVVMPVYNGELYLREAIDSILNQTWRDLELIIVDDNSGDSTPEILQSYDDERVVVVKNSKKHGPAWSRNRGLANARGEYVACMDADDIALPRRLELQVKFLKRNPQVALVGGATTTIDWKGNHGYTLQPPTDSRLIKESLTHSNCYVQSTVMMRTDAVLALQGYRFPLAEDYDLWLRMSESYELGNLTEIVLLYRVHDAQISLQQMKALAMWAIGAQVSARGRRQSGCDPMLGVETLRDNDLSDLGVEAAEIQSAVADSFLIRLNLLLKTNQRGGLELTKSAPKFLRVELISREVIRDVALRVLGLAHHFYFHEQYRVSKELLKLAFRLDRRLLTSMKAIRLTSKLTLGERGTRWIQNLNRRFARLQSSAT